MSYQVVPYWTTLWVGFFSLAISPFIILFFRKRLLGLLDPLTFFIITRLSPLIFVLLTLVDTEGVNKYYYFLGLISSIIFIITLFFSLPKIYFKKTYCSNLIIKNLYCIVIFILLIKITILSLATGGLPLFLEGGSNASIEFDNVNKIGNSILLALGLGDIVLLSFLIPLSKGWTKKFAMLFLVLAIALSVLNGKKSSMIIVLISVSFGEYLRVAFIVGQKPFFLRIIFLFPLVLLSLLWAALIYHQSEIDINWDNLNLLDIIFTQYAFPYFMFISGDLANFFESYKVNQVSYLFHSILSPLGFPAFDASIGPALVEFETGALTGNGINPTFLSEGYVLLGIYMPIYAAIVAYIIGKTRSYIFKLKNLYYKILLSALIVPMVYTLAIDALYFMKILFGLFIIFVPLKIIYGTLQIIKLKNI